MDANFPQQVSASITNKTADNSILPQDVGNIITVLFNVYVNPLIISYTNKFNANIPASSSDDGLSGQITYDDNYFYNYTGTRWNRVAWDTGSW